MTSSDDGEFAKPPNNNTSANKNTMIQEDNYYSAPSHGFISFRDIEDSLQSFSGDDFTQNIELWLQDFDDTAALCGWDDAKRIIYAHRLLKGSAKSFIKYERKVQTWTDLKNLLISEFACDLTSKELHFQLASRKKRINETYHEYLYKMLDIASQGNIELKAIIGYVIDGIPENSSKVVLYGAHDLKTFREKLRMYEEILRNEAKAKRSSTFKDLHHKDNYYERHEESGGKTPRCFCCGSKSHKADSCPNKAKGPKCFRCNTFGHIASSCTTPKKAPPIISTNNVNETNRLPEDKKPVVNVSCKDVVFRALVDSGSDLSFVSECAYQKLGAPALSSSTSFVGVGASHRNTLGHFTDNIKVYDDFYLLDFHVLPNHYLPQKYDFILGANFFAETIVTMERGVTKIKKVDKAENFIFFIDVPQNSLDLNIDSVDPTLKKTVEDMVLSYTPVKTKEPTVEMNIIVTDDAPVYQRPRRLSPLEKEDVNNQLSRWLEDKIIQPSSSDYASPIVLVKKKNGKRRICVDYRRLNTKIVKERFPLPLIEDHIDSLAGAKVYTTLDLTNGFFHVKVNEASRKYTAFVVPDGHYEFLKVPFGLCNSPAVFQKFIQRIFDDLIRRGIVKIYIDDCVIPSATEQENVERLKLVFQIASEYGLNFNWEKCQFLQKRISYLGHIIENGHVRPSDEKTEAVMKFRRPNSAKEVQSFLGLTGYFRKFMPHYATIARPLSDLLRLDVPFVFGDKQVEAFHTLKSMLSTQPVLRLYCPHATTELHTDASKFGFGAVLLQLDDVDGRFHPIYYASGKTSPAEERYTSYDLEVLAIIKALRKFRVYLLGIPFKLVTDCKAFAMTMKKADLCVRVARWALLLEEFEYSIEHRPGKSLTHVDCLSRMPLPVVMQVDEDRTGLIAKLRRCQQDDNSLKPLLADPTKHKEYTIMHGLLYKNVAGDLLLVVPKAMQVDIIRKAHSQGHFSVDKTEALLKREYYFPNMRQLTQRVLRNCVDCILAERKSGKQEGYLHPIDKGDLPLDTYHIDHLGPLGTTKKGYNHIFLVIDAFSKFSWLYPTKSTGTSEVIDKLKQQAVVFGNPKRLISDRGAGFTSHVFEEYCEIEGIHHLKTTTGIPRSNGQVERINRIVVPLLMKLTPDITKWFKYVPLVQQFLNSTPSRSTGFSPFELLIGRKMTLKDNPEIRQIIEQECVSMFEESRDLIRDQAKQNILKIQEENRRNFDKKRKAAKQYNVGDLVAIQRTQPGTKLQSKFLGPYQIETVKGNDRYVVKKIGAVEGPKITTTAADHVKPWYEPLLEDYPESDFDDVEQVPEDANEVRTAECGKRIRRRPRCKVCDCREQC